ncbi:hypothetical protein H010_10296 [Hydrogenophaga taeniospiralis CCUG 15921]|uniref:Uncharacterized protein n=1 Tax=Hydrogenophaga taeniospiralis CCUG 15921 TaxID=1281780 RepID=A0A9X4P3R8_9BURK|nr:hypothetical protein [Hydrogenophaga taeniospiralis CCUG 15921]
MGAGALWAMAFMEPASSIAPRGSRVVFEPTGRAGVCTTEVGEGWGRAARRGFFRWDMVAVSVEQVFGWLQRRSGGAVAGWSRGVYLQMQTIRK